MTNKMEIKIPLMPYTSYELCIICFSLLMAKITDKPIIIIIKNDSVKNKDSKHGKIIYTKMKEVRFRYVRIIDLDNNIIAKRILVSTSISEITKNVAKPITSKRHSFIKACKKISRKM